METTMSGPPSYILHKSYLAVSALAIEAGSLRDRLRKAWWPHLNSFTTDVIPWNDLKENYDVIKREIIPQISLDPDKQVKDDSKLQYVAQLIVDFYSEVAKKREF